jgi:diguanylate cyclase (GGDEF)-like protein
VKAKTQKKKSKVLIVEDDPSSATLIADSMLSHYAIDIVTSGQAALDYCAKSEPDLILMDIAMPAMDGLMACKALKHTLDTSHIPVVFITAHTQLKYEDMAWEAGCADFVTKPFSPKALRHRIKHHLNVKLLTDKLLTQANIDGLTGLQNRRAFDTSLKRQLKLSKRVRTDLGLLMVDIDYFKKYNDTYGHLAGDDCLKKLANVLTRSLDRPTDNVARFGGEEFVILLPDTDLNGVEHVAQNIIKDIKKQKIAHSSSDFSVLTVSIGGTTLENHDENELELIKRADDLLYKAKKNGRNRAHIE